MIIKALKWVVYGIVVLIDKLGNVLTLGNWHKTISMRTSFACHCSYVVPRYKWVRPFANFVDLLFWNDLYHVEENHIYHSYEAEEVLSKSFWKWFIVIDHEAFAALEAEVLELRRTGQRQLAESEQIQRAA